MPKDLEHLLSEGRGKLLPISRELVLDCIATQKQEITRIARVSLPDELHVISAYYDSRAGCFMLVIYSEEFDPVPPGTEVPLFHDYEMVSLNVVESARAVPPS
jgi:hypothetical protein